MPHINRIRVNNVKYNFGTQYYDDFVMRFSCKNTIYDLANGGGKSVLMLLLLQNLIPNCTLDEKQPIEKMFRTGSGNSVIHSMIEWRLSDVHVKNGYKYMTTGFCARKAKDSSLDAENSENGEQDTETGNSKENASIEYFNYCIFYREFNDNDIKNLPLSNGKERITYNGLKTYLRELEKKDLSLEIKIFDRKNEYQRFISGYGLYESEWEIIRGINKTEGHVRTYFESNYKTARKVVEDLLIEEIIQKSFNNTVSDTGKDAMAQTLMDIKDQLVELSKRKEDINNFDFQAESLENFINRIAGLKQLYLGREDLNRQIGGSLLTIRKLIEECDFKIAALEEEADKLIKEKEEAVKKTALSEVRLKETDLEKIKAEVTELSEKINEKEAFVEGLEKDLILKESANDYLDYVYYRGERDRIKEYIESIDKGEEEVRTELHELAAEKKKRNEKRISMQQVILKEERENLEGEEKFAKELENTIREEKENIAVTDYIIKETGGKLDRLAAELTSKKSEANLLIISIPDNEITETKKKLGELKEEEQNISEEKKNHIIDMERISMQLKEAEAGLEELNEKLRNNIDRREKLAEERNHINKMLTIYGSKDEEELYDIIMGRMVENTININEDRETVAAVKKRIEKMEQGIFTEETEGFRMVFDYISKYHGNCILEGSKYLERFPVEKKEELLEKVPFLPYAIVVTDKFDNIMADVHLREMKLGGYFVPIIKEEALDGRDGVITDDAVFAMESNKIYTNEAAAEREIKAFSDMLKEKESISRNHEGANEVYAEDIKYLRYYFSKVKVYVDSTQAEYEKIRENIKKSEEIIDEKERETVRLSKETEELKVREAELSDEIRELGEKLSVLCSIKELSDKGDELEKILNEAKTSNAKSRKALTDGESKYEALKVRMDNRRKKCYDIEESIKKINESWKKIFGKYYVEGTYKSIILPDDELEARLKGLIEVVESGNSDLADKQKLLENFDIAMEKSLQAIDYKGISLEEIVAAYERFELQTTDKETLLNIKNSIQSEKSKLKSDKNEYAVLRSRSDKVEGAIAEAKKKIIEKYGEEQISDFPDGMVSSEEFIADMQNCCKQCDEKLKMVQEDIKKLQEKRQGRLLSERDLDRIVNSGNINIDKNVQPFDTGEDIEEKIADITLHYDEFVKETYDRKADFDRDKSKLVELLIKTGASPLAEELRRSIEMPQDTLEAEELIKAIKEVISCIFLEKERVEKSMEEMARIKENFENQCIQSCISIKTQLDRLPKLSKITMEEQTISIISLNIPYVKEDMYKERMSRYIDDIVMAADNIKDRNEKLKYIRNQLAWKKLFSVIVTDMNGIRLNLYKRERIKEQSRYLPYEEAVGSTGQSQGIYIQFLIAIINYITNINSKDADNTGLRKVIFIDNPFGAAKDVYIWEPIFKLLKVNNVQLIVPARGATPAITGRFDVNYILGQKLIDGKQQTVVVDYNSNVDSDKLDYTKVDFTQAQLF